MSNGSTSPESEQLPLLPPDPPKEPKKNSNKRTSENTLLNALLFVAHAQPKRTSVTAHNYCRIVNHHVHASGPVLSASIAIPDDNTCCPNTRKLIEALKQCPETPNLTVLPTGELSIKSGLFHAVIPCVAEDDLPWSFPDRPQFPVSIEFQQALEMVGKILPKAATLVLYGNAQLLYGSIIGTNGEVILEAAHNCTTPVGCLVPKVFIDQLARIRGKAIYNLGASLETLTAHLSDGSWLKTRMPFDPERHTPLDADFPQMQKLLDFKVEYMPTPHGLWAAVDRLAPFSTDGRIYFRKEGICTSKYSSDGAINSCQGLPQNLSFSIDALRVIAPLQPSELAFNVTARMTYFKGHRFRGAITQRVEDV